MAEIKHRNTFLVRNVLCFVRCIIIIIVDDAIFTNTYLFRLKYSPPLLYNAGLCFQI